MGPSNLELGFLPVEVTKDIQATASEVFQAFADAGLIR